jgi:hypothetical protein
MGAQKGSEAMEKPGDFPPASFFQIEEVHAVRFESGFQRSASVKHRDPNPHAALGHATSQDSRLPFGTANAEGAHHEQQVERH